MRTFSPHITGRFQDTINPRFPIVLRFTSGAFTRVQVAEMIVALQRVLNDYDNQTNK